MISRHRYAWRFAALLVLATASTAPHAQDATPVNILPNTDLADHLRTLARSPRDLNALIGAGQSALGVGDATAALHFFGRANEVAPNDGRVKAGLGSTLLLLERPDDALRLFGEAVALGVPQATIASDRGLAYDLRGDQRSAQRDYQLALRQGETDELLRRYALSLGISGQKNEGLSKLDPLLRKQDQAAWRDRTFILAMNGDMRGANSITRTLMPQQADAMTPFLKRLSSFTPAQRALAVTYGTMPEDARPAAAIPPNVVTPVLVAAAKPLVVAPSTPAPRFEPAPPARMPAPPPVRTAIASAGPVNTWFPPALPAPTGPETSVTSAAADTNTATPRFIARQTGLTALPAPDGTLPSAPTPKPPTAVVARVTGLTALPTPTGAASLPNPTRTALSPPAQSPTVQSPAPLIATPVVPKVITPAAPVPIERPAIALAPPLQGPAQAGPALAATPAAVITAPKPLSALPVAVTAQPKFSLTALLDDVTPDARAPLARVRTDKELRAARQIAKKKADEKAKLEAKVKAEADARKAEEDAQRALERKNPPREWVQIAGGNNRSGFALTWKRLKSANDALYQGRSAYYTPLNRTYRILVGPFKSSEDARTFINKMGKTGHSGFAYSSEAGQVVTKIASK